MKDDNKEIFEASGRYCSTDPLVGFLYILMRDGCPTAAVEEALRQMTTDETDYTNGWLAQYAENVKRRLMQRAGLVYKELWDTKR